MKDIVSAGLIFLVLLCHTEKVSAQLEYVPRIDAAVVDSQNLQGVVLLDTRDFHFHYGAESLYPSTLQIVDPLQPWPPIFFANAAPGGKGMIGKGTYQDVRFQYASGQLTFFKGVPDKSGAYGKYVISDTNFNVIDTIESTDRNIDSHDFQINAKGERLYMTMLDTILDLSPFTENLADTAVLTTLQKIEIIDANKNRVFSWNPLDHIPIPYTCLKYNDLTGNNFYTKGWDWSHGNSVRFTHDGNIVYSYRHLGVGKINRQTGKIMWKLGGKSPTIRVPKNGEYYEQHDFQEIAPGYFSLFSNGNEKVPCKAMVYYIDEQTNTAKLAKTYVPATPIFPLSMGSYETGENGLCVFNYGRYASLEERQTMFEIIDTAGNVHALYSSPALNYSFQVHYVPTWKPAHLVILNESGILKVGGPATSVVWYRLDGTKLLQVSKELTCQPKEKGVYIAISKTGFGWLCSKPFLF